ncbi:MAG: LamG domain-containing protein [Candidatus Freyarchaeota archaeon]
MRRLLALLLIFALLAQALPAKAETSYYALSFDGEDDYVEVGDIDYTDISILVLFYVNDLTSADNFKSLISKREGDGWEFRLGIDNGQLQFVTWDSGETATVVTGDTIETKKHYLAAVVVQGSDIKLYLNSQIDAQGTLSNSIANTASKITIGRDINDPDRFFDGKIYLMLIYNRALSDTEIQQIYDDPLNPPTDGLVLWLAPDSVDTANDIWTDKSGQGNDGTIYGATPERVSIPRLYVYDANTSEQISYMNVSLTLIANNTTTGLIPSLPILPWNETVSLNISAINYESRTISTWTGVDLISVYLTQDTVQLSVPSEFNYTFVDLATLNVSANVSLEKMLNLFHHWPGGSLLDGLFRLNVSQFIKDVFTFDISVESHSFSWVGMLITGIIWFGAELFAWFYFKNPLPVIALGRILYEGMSKFATPAFEILQIPIAGFLLYMGYLTIKMMFEKWSGER